MLDRGDDFWEVLKEKTTNHVERGGGVNAKYLSNCVYIEMTLVITYWR